MTDYNAEAFAAIEAISRESAERAKNEATRYFNELQVKADSIIVDLKQNEIPALLKSAKLAEYKGAEIDGKNVYWRLYPGKLDGSRLFASGKVSIGFNTGSDNNATMQYEMLNAFSNISKLCSKYKIYKISGQDFLSSLIHTKTAIQKLKQSFSIE